MLLNKIKNKNKYLLTEEEILNRLKIKNYRVVMTIGAGNIDLLIPKIKEIISA
jgi:UDP-N-acetylmuramate--alanine ligase